MALRVIRDICPIGFKFRFFGYRAKVDSKYPFLRELGLLQENKVGTGDVFTSYNPATNEAIGSVQGHTLNEYHTILQNVGSLYGEFKEGCCKFLIESWRLMR